MKYGLMSYEYGKYYDSLGCNLGDEIQSIAASCFLPYIDKFIDREKLAEFKSEEKVKLIMNGWYIHDVEQWPPSSDIEPLLVSMHFTNNKKLLKNLFKKQSV